MTPIPPSDAATSSSTSNGSNRSSTSGLSNNGDPLLLASRLQSEEHIQNLRQRKQRRKQGKDVGEFYKKQNKQIQALLMTMDQHIESAQEDEDTNRLAVRLQTCVQRFG
jgi:hypothetical protein